MKLVLMRHINMKGKEPASKPDGLELIPKFPVVDRPGLGPGCGICIPIDTCNQSNVIK